MWLQFYLENIHFAINLFAGLIFFAVSYLYLDAWIGRKSTKELIRSLGFLSVSLSFVVHGSSLESTLLPQTILEGRLTGLLYSLTHLGGYLLIIFSLLKDRLEHRPKTEGLTKESYNVPGLVVFNNLALPAFSWVILPPLFALITALLYLRRAFWGLEHHLKPIALSFLVLALYEFLSLATLLRTSENVDLYNLAAPFGTVWVIEHLALLLAVLILGKWIYGYLLKQLQTQLMMIFSSAVLTIFLVTTVTFTSLLVNNLKEETLKQLETNTKVLDLALKSKKEQNLSDAQVLAQNPEIKKAISAKTSKVLTDTAQSFLVAKRLASVTIVDGNGQVVARGEDPERVGDSLSDNTLVKRALLNQTSSSIVVQQGVVSPKLIMISAAPISQDPKKQIGAVLVGTTIDNSFIDNVKKASSLEASVYAGDTLSATTLTLADNKSRAVGVKLPDQKIVDQVIKEGKSFKGEAEILNQPFFVSLVPLKDINNQSVGMLFVGEHQTGTLITAGRSIELTFIVAALLLMLSILPATVISKEIAYQLH